jgi:hypothetical protein
MNSPQTQQHQNPQNQPRPGQPAKGGQDQHHAQSYPQSTPGTKQPGDRPQDDKGDKADKPGQPGQSDNPQRKDRPTTAQANKAA